MPLINTPLNVGPHWLLRREWGLKNPLGTRHRQAKQLYQSLAQIPVQSANARCGIFSLEYSPSGSILVAACQSNKLLILDPTDTTRGHTVDNAHADCVNCIKFLDQNTFATCSDDFLVALWDVRNTSSRLKSFRGHDNWVKSIDYSPADNLLLTSGFDGSILGWDLTKNEEVETGYQKFFSMNGLMRSRLSPDGSKLVISTTGGFIMVIHNLDLGTLKEDLRLFKPNLYRLMQLSQTILRPSSDFTHMFRGSGKRNRVEFICDFPDGNDAEVIASVQIHPEGHSVLSRNTSHEDASEWTCVHNIEENLMESDNEDSEQVCWLGVVSKSTQPTYVIRTMAQEEIDEEDIDGSIGDLTFSPTDVWEAMVHIRDARLRRTVRNQVEQRRHLYDSRGALHEEIRRRISRSQRERRREIRNGGSGEASNSRLRMEFEPNETARLERDREELRATHSRTPERVLSLGVFQPVNQGTSVRRHNVATLTIASSDGDGDGDSDSDHERERDRPSAEEAARTSGASSSSSSQFRDYSLSSFTRVQVNKNIHQNINRLAYYVEEPNVVMGFIKEPCFSTDGRVICSPYKLGIRLLSFSPELHLPWQFYPDKPPIKLHQVSKELFGVSDCDAVVSTKFRPNDNQLVVGSLNGHIYTFNPYR